MTRLPFSVPALSALAAAALLAGCMHGRGGPMAEAALKPTANNRAEGVVRFHQHGASMHMYAKVSGLTPNQEHGFHIHEKGDCSAPDATSAGGHFNPTGAPHGRPGQGSHAGDLPALKADATGVAEVRGVIEGVTLDDGAANSIAGRGLIVHAQPDDYRTQPTGNSGARVACAVIVKR